MHNETKFQAYVLRKDKQGVHSSVENLTMKELPEGDVTVRVLYSGVNYKDGLASLPDGRIVRRYPFIPGIDLAGTVVHSDHPDYKEGDSVLCTGYELGVSHEGVLVSTHELKEIGLYRSHRVCPCVMQWP